MRRSLRLENAHVWIELKLAQWPDVHSRSARPKHSLPRPPLRRMRKLGCSRTAFPPMMPRRYGDQCKKDQVRSRPALNYWESHPFDKFNDLAVATELLANLHAGRPDPRLLRSSSKRRVRTQA